jgi:hypothetical protein
MEKLIVVRKILKILYPNLKVIVRYNKKQYFEIILKNVNGSEVDDITFKVMLLVPGQDSFVLEDFVESLFKYCPIVNEDNCIIKYIDKKGGRQITKTLP